MGIKLSDLRKKQMIAEVQAYFRKEYDEDIGELKAEMFLDFFIEKLGPGIYNQAIADANSFIQEKLIDLEDILSLPE